MHRHAEKHHHVYHTAINTLQGYVHVSLLVFVLVAHVTKHLLPYTPTTCHALKDIMAFTGVCDGLQNKLLFSNGQCCQLI